MKLKILVTMILALCFIYAGTAEETKETANVAGEWSITITFIAGTGHHTAIFEQKGEKLSGVYKGQFKEGTLRGKIKGNTIEFTGYLKHEATRLSFSYKGTIEDGKMKGTVGMGEFWSATWTAERAKKKK